MVRAAGCLQTRALCIGASGVSKQGWLDIPSRSLMRAPVVKRRTSPASGFFAFFPLFRSGHRRHPVTCPDGISRCRGSGRVTASHTHGSASAVETTIAGLLRGPCDRETSLDPHSVLRQVVAARVSGIRLIQYAPLVGQAAAQPPRSLLGWLQSHMVTTARAPLGYRPVVAASLASSHPVDASHLDLHAVRDSLPMSASMC